MSVEPFPLIELSGSAGQRGRDYGRQAAARVRRSIEHYTLQLAADGHGVEKVRGWARDFLPRIEAFDPAYIEEMRGIAEGAEVPFEDIVLINARTEVLQLGKRSAASKEPDGCTGVVVLPEASADGTLIHAQNWDWKSECAETGVVLRIRREDGPDILTFVEAGGLARAGLNAAGIAVTANYLQSDRDYQKLGVPLALIRRKMLEKEFVAQAFHAAYTTVKSASNNIIVSQAAGVVINFECAPDESFQVHATNGLIVHANHWISPVALSKLKDTGVAATPDSLYRDMRVRQLLEAHKGGLDVAKVKAALFDDYQHPWSVCRPPRLNSAGNLSATVAMLVMQPAKGVLEIAPLPALNHQFTRYELFSDAEARAAA
ncbi:C45 family peptidase [Roseomonas gilardii]|uniref:C45 family peptidase n=1 Tax=Roseomonas gilardii TaxID=257708 RepID=A0ABU3MJK4_9PROT|nr:C45 family peptidase [Roseomonas gilardii]MDT8333199.1 C45 family peptidase [Roseomonas gilardii]